MLAAMARIRRWLCLACAAAMAAFAIAAGAAPAPIYRCVLGDGSVLYTDTPCRGGETVNVNAGEADPRAIERLRVLQQEASAQYARERALAQEQAAELRMMEAQRAYAQPAPPAPPAEAFVGPYDYFAPSYLTPADPRRHRERPPAVRRRQSFVPAR